MTKMRFVQAVTPVLISIFTISSEVQAQKAQTIESAQEFLSSTSESSSVIFSQDGQFPIRNNYSYVKFSPSSYDKCTSNLDINLDFEYQSFGAWDKIKQPQSTPNNWKLVAKVTRSGNVVIVRWSNGMATQNFVYPTDELATRAAFAMEFLRLNCDPTSNLAF